MKIAMLVPAHTLGVGFFIREQMEYRNWDDNILSEKSGVEKIELNSLLESKKPLTFETAKALANVFGISYQYWLNLDFNSNQNKEKL
jgi:plasmid maintenance system antidote protein VapI